MVRIQNIQFPERNTIWTDQGGWNPVGQSIRWDINGMPIVETSSFPKGGRPLTLEIRNATWEQVQAVEAMKNSLPAGAFPVEVPPYFVAGTMAEFRHEEDMPVEWVPLRGMLNYQRVKSYPFFTIIIKMRIID